MISFSDESKFYIASTDFQYSIVPTKTNVNYPTFTNAMLEGITLSRAICQESDIMFGSVNTAKLEFTVRSSCDSLIGAKLVLSISLDSGTALQVGEYYVKEDEKTADITKRKVVAYDALGSVMDKSAVSWWESIWPSASTELTIKQIRDSFASTFGLTQKTQTLCNDSFSLKKPITGDIDTTLVLKHIAQINGAFARVNSQGELEWKTLGSSVKTLSSSCIQQGAHFASYASKSITELKLKENDDDIGVTVGTSGHMYTITGNIFSYGATSSQKTTLATNVLSTIGGFPYVPCNFKMVGNLCLEAGDRITVSDGSDTFETVMLQSRVELGQNIVDNVVSEGNEVRSSSTSMTADKIDKLRQRALELQITIDGINAALTQLEDEVALETDLQALAGRVDLKVSKTDGTSSSKSEFTIDPTNGVVFDTHSVSNGFTVKADGTDVLAVNKNGLNVTGSGTFTGTVYASAGSFEGSVGANGLRTTDGDEYTEIKGGALVSFGNNGVAELKGGVIVAADVEGKRSNLHYDAIELWDNMTQLFGVDRLGIRSIGLCVGSAHITDTGQTSITFPHTMPNIPYVVASYVQSSWNSGTIGAIKIKSVTTTGFQASISGTWSGGADINYIAIC